MAAGSAGCDPMSLRGLPKICVKILIHITPRAFDAELRARLSYRLSIHAHSVQLAGGHEPV
jgi:hypothetical protein